MHGCVAFCISWINKASLNISAALSHLASGSG
jgi:hypothetical protein